MRYGNSLPSKKFALSPLVLVGLLFVLGLAIKATWSIYHKTVIETEKLSQASAELARLEVQKKDLEEEVKRLSTDQGIEAELRTKYRAVKEGESVAVILDNNNTAAAINTATTSPNNADTSWLGKLLQIIGF